MQSVLGRRAVVALSASIVVVAIAASLSARPTPQATSPARACLIEGQVMGETIKDCTETRSAQPVAALTSQCEETAAAMRSMGGVARASVLAACPAKPQGVCAGLLGRPVSAYYYARSPQSLAAAKRGCLAQRGQWRDG